MYIDIFDDLSYTLSVILCNIGKECIMKKSLRVLSLVMAIVMLCLCVASCSKKATATVSIKFVSTDEDGTEHVHLTQPAFSVEGSNGEQPSVLDAAMQVLKEYEVVYELTADGNSLAAAFDLKQEDSHDESYGYYKYWKCTINGSDSAEGRQSATPIYKDDVIVFTWTEGQNARLDTVAEETTNAADFETELFTEQETEPETEPAV